MKREQAEIHRLLDAKEAHQPGFEHDCEKCIFLGHYSDYRALGDLDFYDLYLCIKEPTVIVRYGNEGSEYSSGNCAGFFQNIPALALAAELAIRHMAIMLGGK